MSKWYGSLNNRLEENHQFCDEIKVGTGMTEYLWSDRHAYEVVEVKDQKHIFVREFDHVHVGGPFENNWDLVSNENNPVCEMAKRGKYWYFITRISADILDAIENCEDNSEKYFLQLVLVHNQVDPDDLRKKGKIIRYKRANVSFGKAEYYYDYEF